MFSQKRSYLLAFCSFVVNPRRVHCYSDEDLVGKVKKLCTRCHGATVGVRAISRYCILLSIRWWHKLAEIRDLLI